MHHRSHRVAVTLGGLDCVSKGMVMIVIGEGVNCSV